MDKFSVEEINLMCIYDTASRQSLLDDLRAGLRDVYEPEMKDIFDSAIAKLETLSEDDFAGIGFYIADEFDAEGAAFGE